MTDHQLYILISAIYMAAAQVLIAFDKKFYGFLLLALSFLAMLFSKI